MSEREKELLEKLKLASQQENNFTLTLKYNEIELERRVFPADKFELRTLSETRTHFLMNDLIRQVVQAYTDQEKIVQEDIKKEQMEAMWDEMEKKNKSGEQ